MKKLNLLLVVMLSFVLAGSISAQGISAAAQLGWSVPGGAGVSDNPDDLNLDGGLTYGVDVLYQINDNLGAGVFYSASILAGAGDGTLNIDAYGLNLFGVKGMYRLREGFSPYGALSLGLAQLSTPEVSSGGTVLVEANKGSGFAIVPEVGLLFGKFFIAGQYLVPVKYTIEEANVNDKALGVLNINVGYRYYLDL